MTRSVIGALAVAAALAAGCSDETSSPTDPTTLANSGGSSSSTGCTPPSAPSNLRVSSISGTLVELIWNPVVGATSYTLLVGGTPGASDVLNANTSQNSFRFTARDGRQFARVQAHSACGPGPSTGSIEFTVR